MYLFGQADATRIPMRTQSCDLVIGSPPYVDCRTYLEDGQDLGIARKATAWVEWMMKVSREAVRVSRGAVLWVVAGKTEDRNYQPGPEGLIWEWYKSGGFQECPCYWHRVGICGSGGDQWFRKDVEHVLAFKREPKLPWSDNTANGHPPKWAPGGKMSHRLTDGTRRNEWGMSPTSTGMRRPNGERRTRGVTHTKRMKGKSHESGSDMEVQHYIPPAVANPGNYIPINEASSVVDVKVGGGHLGWDGAHENEAPFPQQLAEWFIRSLCPPGGVVCDPFSGSGTVVRAALATGRRGIGFDLRMSQCRLGKRGVDRPHATISKPSRQSEEPVMPLFRNIPT